MPIEIPYMRNKTPTLLVFSAKKIPSTLLVLSPATLLLLLISPLLLFNVLLLQPVQAEIPVSFRKTTESAADGNSTSSISGGDSDSNVSFRTPTAAHGSLCTDDVAYVTFDVQGTASSGYQNLNVTGGTFQITSSSGGQILYSGTITSGHNGGRLTMEGPLHSVPSGTACATRDQGIAILTSCSTSNTNSIDVINEEAGIYIGDFSGPVECSSQGGDTTTPEQQSSSMTGSAQDSDGDGIPDSSDRCAKKESLVQQLNINSSLLQVRVGI